MAASSQTVDAVVVGAGIAGLVAADELTRCGRRVVVLEKSRGVGGRMATRRVGAAVCDHGAQFFTVRDERFGSIVAGAREAAAVAAWCDGFSRADSIAAAVRPAADGHTRWRGVRGMTDLPKRLAAVLPADRCEIRTGRKAAAIAVRRGVAHVTLEPAEDATAGVPITAAAVILTAPVPQSLDLLAAGGTLAADGPADPEARSRLETVAYDPCFAVMLVLDRPSLVPPPGGIQFAAGPVSWLADNHRKGISPVPSLTVHASGDFSRRHFDEAPDLVAARLVDLVRPWIPGDPAAVIVERSVHRWKFATPTTVLPEPCVAISHAPPILCCGDAFAGPRVEGAAASGLAAARAIVAAAAR